MGGRRTLDRYAQRSDSHAIGNSFKIGSANEFVALVRYESEKQRFENSELMLRTAWEELKRVSATLDDFLKDAVRHDAVRRLILDATRKAEDLRDRKRVERIGKILAYALTLSMSDFDKAEEMMRIAGDLSDADVLGYATFTRPNLKRFSATA